MTDLLPEHFEKGGRRMATLGILWRCFTRVTPLGDRVHADDSLQLLTPEPSRLVEATVLPRRSEPENPVLDRLVEPEIRVLALFGEGCEDREELEGVGMTAVE